MTRRWFPDESSRLGYSILGQFLAHARGKTVFVYADPAASVPADILDANGISIVSLQVDAYSRFPLWQGPPDGTDTLYLVVDGGPVTTVYARTDDRLDDLNTRLAAVEGTTVGQAAASLQKTANLSDVASPAAARASLGLGSAATQPSSAFDAAGAATAVQTAAATDATTKATAAQTAAQAYADAGDAGKAQATLRTAVKTANYAAAAGQLVPVDTATPNANITVTLPSAPAVGSRVAVKHIAVGTGKSVTVACAGSDVFNKAAGSTSVSLTLLNQAVTVQYDAGIWTVVSDDLPLSALSGAYLSFLTPSLTGDDTAQIMAAYNAAVAAGAGVVRLGPGTFTVNTAADGLTWASGVVSLIGAGKQATNIQGGALTTSSVLNITLPKGGLFADFSVNGRGFSTNAIKQSVTVEDSIGTRYERVHAHGSTSFQWVNDKCEDVTYWDCSTDGNEGAPTTVPPALKINVPFGLVRIFGSEFFGKCDLTYQVIEVVAATIGPIVINNSGSITSTVLKLDGCYIYDGGPASDSCISSADHFTNVSANGCYFVGQTNRAWIKGDIPAGVSIALRNSTYVWGPHSAGSNYVVQASGAGAVVIDGYGSELGAATLNLFNPVSSATTAVKVRSATKATGPAQNLKSGGYQFLGGSTSIGTSNGMGVGTFRCFPVWIDAVTTLTRIGAEVTAIGDVGSKVRLGIYADDGSGYPGALVSDCGQIAGDSATVQELTISVTLTPGLYWFGAVVQSVTTTQPTIRTWVGNYLFSPAYSTLPPAGANPTGYGVSGYTGALLATFDAWSSNVSGTMPRIFVKAA